MIGVLMSATLPARLGEPAGRWRSPAGSGRMRESFPIVLGTLVSQTLLNLVALVMLGVIIVSHAPASFIRERASSCAYSAPPLRCCWPVADRAGAGSRRNGNGPAADAGRRAPARGADPGAGGARACSATRGAALAAAAAQLGAWAIQLAACYALLVRRSGSTASPGSAPLRPCCSR